MALQVGEPNPVITLRRVTVILNPVSGVGESPEGRVRELLETAPHIEWTIQCTQRARDAFEMAQEANAHSADLVIAAGGDGTVLEVAQALMYTGTPMSIFPLGTANVMSVELGFPPLPRIVAALAAGEFSVKSIDMAMINETPMLLRAGIGLEAEMSVGATREEKARYGRFAYVMAVLRQLYGRRPTLYRIEVDDKRFSAHGLTCMICNSASIGVTNLSLSSRASVSDGLLDVIVIPNARLPSIARLVWSVIRSSTPTPELPPIPQWQGRQVTVSTIGPQVLAVDGEPQPVTRMVKARVLANALTVVVPVPVPVKAEGVAGGR